jgi:hypothetical protein
VFTFDVNSAILEVNMSYKRMKELFETRHYAIQRDLATKLDVDDDDEEPIDPKIEEASMNREEWLDMMAERIVGNRKH